MPRIAITLAAITLYILSGCQAPCQSCHHRNAFQQKQQAKSAADCGQPVAEVLPSVALQASYPPSLLFDRYPGMYSATDFAYRSDWPSTNSYYSPGEAIYYRMYSVDYQGPGRDSWNSTYRRFETQRVGRGYR